jgi:hypothetical protein
MEVDDERERIVRRVSGWNIKVEETLAFRATKVNWTVHTTNDNII